MCFTCRYEEGSEAMRRITFSCIYAALLIALFTVPSFAEEATEATAPAVPAVSNGSVATDDTGAATSAAAQSYDDADSGDTQAADTSEEQAPCRDGEDAPTPNDANGAAPLDESDGGTPQKAPEGTPDANEASDDTGTGTATDQAAGNAEGDAEENTATVTDQTPDSDPAAESDADKAAPCDAAATAADTASDAKPAETAASKSSPATASKAIQSAKATSTTAKTAKASTANPVKTTTTPAKATAAPVKATVKKAASQVADKRAYLVHNAVYCISTALAKKNVYTLGVRSTPGKGKYNVVLLSAAKELSQFWHALYQGKGVYRFWNYSAGYYLAVQGAVKKRANVHDSYAGIIDWKVSKNADGTFSLSPVSKAKGYLSVKNSKAKAGANVQLWTSIKNKGQKFTFTRNNKLTKAFKEGKRVKGGIVKVSLAGSSIRLGIANGSKAEGALAATTANSGSKAQVFELRSKGNGLYELLNANSLKALSIHPTLNNAGTALVQRTRTDNLRQVWYLKESGDGYQIISAHTGHALQVNGGKVASGKYLHMDKPSNAATQKFTFTPTQLIANGTYVVQSSMAAPFVLGMTGSVRAKTQNVQLNRSSGAAIERYTFKYLGDGMYRITNASTKKALAVNASSKKEGANIHAETAANAARQKWTVQVGDTGYMFKSAVSGKYLNVDSKQAKKSANVNQATANWNENQCWNLVSPNWTFYTNVSAKSMKFIKKAESYEGWRYKWGGRSPSTSFDCAGLVMYCSNKALGTKFDLMNTNAEMLYGKCKHIKASEARPGYLVFYRGTYGSDIKYISHVVIYTGRGYMYGAGDPIGYAKVNSVKNFRGKVATAVYARIKR